MRVEVVRSGLVEAVHDVTVAIVDGSGRLTESHGDVDRPFYARSAIKPLQAHVARVLGADLAGPRLAIASASHAGRGDQVAVVLEVLAAAGLGTDDLGTPADLPSSRRALLDLPAGTGPAPVFHNCSGKHAGVLAACRAQGWDLDDYREPGHPAQVALLGGVAETVGGRIGDPGIDGCGFPTPVVTAAGLAAMFARVAVDPDFAPERAAICAHPALIGDTGRPDVVVAGAGFPAKAGAEGCMGVALPAHGIGVGLKVADGATRALGPALAAVFADLGVDLGAAAEGLAEPVLGSGRRVGTVRAVPGTP